MKETKKIENKPQSEILTRFLELTEYLHFLGHEDEMKKFLPKNIQKDPVGNYFLNIGNSDVMFTCHLDTVVHEKTKVVHVIDDDNEKNQVFVSSDGKSILGADDRTGLLILLKMIESNVPGLYYFFIGEERGTVGSSGILKQKPDFFKKYKKCISFDRRGFGSVITEQMGGTCCSPEFSKALGEALTTAVGFKFKDDDTGIYTDSAVFMDDIPECTNISVGYFNEHSVHEYQNITYLEFLCKGVIKVDWENLPVVRDPNESYSRYSKYVNSYNSPRKNKKRNKHKRHKNGNNFTNFDKESKNEIKLRLLYYAIDNILQDFFKLKFESEEFEPEKELIYTYQNGDTVIIVIHNDFTISVGNDDFTDYDDLEYELKTHYKDYIPDDAYTNYLLEAGLYFDDEDNEETNKNLNIWNDKLDDPFYDDEDDEDDIPYYGDKNDDTDDNDEESLRKLGDAKMLNNHDESFEFDIDIKKFISDVKKLVHQKTKNNKLYGYITPGKMNTILSKYNKSVDNLVHWLYARGNMSENCYGLAWDEEDMSFYYEEH